MLTKPNFFRKTFLSIAFAFLFFFEPAHSVLSVPPSCACFDGLDCFCLDDFYARAGYTSASGVGRKVGYTSLAAFYCRDRKAECAVPYLDVRLHYLDNSRLAGNFGIGLQKPSLDKDSLTRGYIFYDFRNTPFHTLNQICVGAEWLGPYFNMTFNSYWPLEQQGRQKVTEFNFPRGFFLKHIRNEIPLNGLEISSSRYFPVSRSFRLFVSPGIYYYFARSKSIVGGRLRLEADLFYGLAVAVETSYDKFFHSKTYGQISWTFPLGCNPCDSINGCVIPVRRQEIIAVWKRDHWKSNF